MSSNKDRCLHQEAKWLLEHEAPIIVEHMSNLVLSCLRQTNSNSSTKHKMICTSSTSGLESLKGYSVLHHDTLCAMEMFIKPTKSLSTIKASFRNDKQWKLQQIQDSYNQLRQVSHILSTFKKCGSSQSEEAVVLFLEEVMKHLIRCRSRLLSPCQLSLQALIGNGFNKMFAPPLPGDTLVNIYLIEDRLIISHYTVVQAHTNASLSASKIGKLHTTALAGRALHHETGSQFDHAGVRYEVVTSNQAECHIPALTEILQTVDQTQIICQDFKDKIIKLIPSWAKVAPLMQDAAYA